MSIHLSTLPPSACIRPSRDACTIEIMARLIDEACATIDYETAVMALIGAGYVSREINQHIDEAMAMARTDRAARKIANEATR